MHQKNTAASPGESAEVENGEEADRAKLSGEPDDVLKNPFDDDGEDEVDDDSDDGLGDDGTNPESWNAGARGSWWRGALRRGAERFGDGRDDSDSNSDREESAGGQDDDEEFGDFAMPEVDKEGNGEKGNVIVKPLPVHPPSQNSKSSAFTSLWPFGSKDKERDKDKQKEKDEADTGSLEEPPDIRGEDGEKIKSTHEAARRTSIEDPDEEEVVI
jgi:hypothetical protein